jgi:hypothetical protein
MGSRARWRLVFVLVGTAGWSVAAGCSSFSGESEPAPAPAAEAGADATPETAAPADAATPFCSSEAGAGALLCADFDEGPVNAKWQGAFVHGGKVELTTSDRSAPNAFLSTVDSFPPFLIADPDAGDGGSLVPFGAAVLTTSLGRGGAPGAVLEFDMRLDELPGAEDGGPSGGDLAVIGFDVAKQSVSLSFFGKQLYLSAKDPQSTLIDGVPVAPPSPPRWFHVRLATDFSGTAAQLSFDGILVATLTQSIKSSAVGIIVDLGAAGSATTGKAIVAYDNVTVRLLP